MSDLSLDELTRRLLALENAQRARRMPQLPYSAVPVDGGSVPLVPAVTEGAAAAAEVPLLLDDVDAGAVETEETYAALLALDEELEAVGGYLAQAREELESKLETGAANLAAAQARLDQADALLAQLDTRLGTALEQAFDEYTVTTSATEPPGPGAVWTETQPERGEGEFLWRRTKQVAIDGTATYSAPVPAADGAPGVDATNLRISSSKGTAFRNNAIATVLTVTVFRGADQIVNLAGLWAAFGAGAYLEWLWRRDEADEFSVISSADPRLSQGGFALTVSPADVDNNTDFRCILHD